MIDIKMNKIIIATKNKHKIEEFKILFKDYELLSLEDIGFTDEIPETADTFEGNAFLKADAIVKKYNLFTIADDSGLEVDFLNGEPGVYSARYAGVNATDAENNEKLLKKLEGIPYENRKARFVSVICGIYPNGKRLSARGECEGFIATEAKGAGKFGYDPIFYYPPFDKTFAEMTKEEKNKISHRGIAVSKFFNSFNLDK